MVDPVNIASLFTFPWVVGLLVSLVGGCVLAGIVTASYRRELSALWNGIPFGVIERVFFTFGVAFALPGIGVAMIGWITAKMVTGWNVTRQDSSEEAKRLRMSALAGNLMSMFAAAFGGLICAGRIVIQSAT